jgi:GT2 family glycosyltransferase
MKRMKLSVIIPNYNGKVLLEMMLPHLMRAVANTKDTEIIVYDNNSSDDSRVFLEDKYPHIRLISSRENDGFTKAVNAGAISAKGEYLLILNNDCVITGKTLHEMQSFLSHYPKYCMTQPVVLDKKGKIENIGFVIDLKKAKAEAITDKKSPFIDESYMKFPTSSGYVYGLSATCLLIKRQDFLDLCMFDESFHSYLEDVDLAIRICIEGKKYFPTLSAECTHEHMATSSKMGSYKQRRDFINWIKIILKNYTLSMILSSFFSLTVERMRNLNGYIKKLRKV